MNNRLISFLAGRGAVPARQVRTELDISPATLSRLAAKAGARVLRLGRARAVHYALPYSLPGIATRLPVYRITPQGKAIPAAELIPLDNGGSCLTSAANDYRLFDGWPPFIQDMAPAGYLGRRFTDRYPDLALPSRLQDWSDNHRLIAVARRGEDCPGDTLVGEESLQRWLDSENTPVTPDDYPQLSAESALGGSDSSAAGEQPKFTAYSENRHVLVKFTSGDNSPSDKRWRDLLLCEGLALDVLREIGIATPQWQLYDIGARRFLELERFDRTGYRGRKSVLSLAALDDEHFGKRDNWVAAAERLHATGMLDGNDVQTIMLLEAFGVCIGNTDRHFGNLIFYADTLQEKPALQLAPIFDMLPMCLAPRAGEVPSQAFNAKPVARLLPEWDTAQSLASRYWQCVAEDDRASTAMHDIARKMQQQKNDNR